MTIYIRDQFVYSAVSTAFAPPATPTDMFTLTGSATKNIYIMKMGITMLQTTAGQNVVHLLKRSAANTGGTSAAAAAVPYNSQDPAATATALQYTVNPAALGASLGDVWAGFVPAVAPATAGPGALGVELNFLDIYGQPLTLLSTAEVVAFNFGGVALPVGLSVIAYAIWYEQSKT
jgi:hypothetical protein